jgi:hypothetical protein
LISRSYKKAAKATFITSATTAAAFVSNVFSQIPALRLFGYFMVIIVSMNWVLVRNNTQLSTNVCQLTNFQFQVITIFPAVLVIWDTRLRYKTWCNLSLKFPWTGAASQKYAMLTSSLAGGEKAREAEPPQNEHELSLLGSMSPETEREGDEEEKDIEAEGGSKDETDEQSEGLTQRPAVRFFANKVSLIEAQG